MIIDPVIRASLRRGADATKLDQYLQSQSFGTIIFQFPNVGSVIIYDGWCGYMAQN